MDFQKLLLDMGRALSKDEVKACAFLCTDLLGRTPSSVESASDLFSRLVDQDQLCPEQPHLLTELLVSIQRTRLARDLGLTDPAPATRSLISPYRKLLYFLSEELTDAEVKDVKFLLNKKLPRRKLEENVTALEIFLEMEHMDLISDTDLDFLGRIIQSVCPMLIGNIDQYKAQLVHHTSPVSQETGPPQSRTYPFGLNQGPESEFKPLAESTNSSSNSFDRPNMSQDVDEFPALCHGLRDLSTETSGAAYLNVRSDAMVISPQEKETYYPKQTCLADTNTILGTYPITAAKKGICLIVNNYDFNKHLQNREGTMVDEECLQKVFKWLGFEVETHRDCKSVKILSVMQELGSRNHSQMDCVVCCVLSHGQEGTVYGVDGHTVNIRKLMEPFNGSNCSSLAGKPKLFFIQACQGTKEQKAVYIEADSHTTSDVQSDAIETIYSIPCDADFLLGMATVPSYSSFRERKKGTWFIQSLCQNLVQMVPRGIDLVSILTKVNADVSQRTDSTGVKKQMPQPAFSLTKKVVFPIPKGSPPIL